MKRSAVIASLGLGALLLAAPKIQDIKGNQVTFQGFAGIKIKKQPDATILATVSSAQGQNVKADWKAEQTVLTAEKITAILSQGYELIRASLSGGITVHADRPSSVAGNRQTIDIVANTAKYTHADRLVEIEGKFTLTRTDKAAGQSMKASGDGGGTVNITDNASAKNALRKAELRGPVNFAMSGVRQQDGKPVPFTIDGRGDRLTYDDASRTIVLSGNVRLGGDDPALTGEMRNIQKATITLDEKGEVDSVELDGSPGESIFTPKTKVPPPANRR